MNLGQEIMQKFIKLNQLEDDLTHADLLDYDSKQQLEDQRRGLRELQHELKSILDKKFPNNDIETAYDMFEQYEFDIKVKKKR